jgi:predicted permease
VGQPEQSGRQDPALRLDTLRWLRDLVHDLGYAVRMLRKHRGFAAVAILTLALGIGANTALFSLLDTVILKSLPVRDPAQLFFFDAVGTKGPNGAPPYPCYQRFRDETRSFAGMAAFAPEGLNLAVDGRVERVSGQYASGSYFDVLGVRPALGRVLTAEDDNLTPPVAVISYGYWQRRFGGDPAVVGKAISLGGRRLTVAGVTPPEFFGLQPGHSLDVTVPFTLQDRSSLDSKGQWWFYVVGRLEPGVPPEQGRAEIDTIFQRFMQDAGSPRASRRDSFDHMELTTASKGLDDLRRRFSRPLLVVMGIVGVVLLIGCANLASLLLARASSRRREFAVRLSIGAGRGRLVRQLLAETMVLFGCGAVAGLILARWGGGQLASYLAVGRTPLRLDVEMDLRVMVFTAGVTLSTGVLFGLVPVLSVIRADPYPALQDAGMRTTASAAQVSLRQALVIAQVALSLVLTVGAALFIRTLVNLDHLDLGFHAERVLSLSVEPPGAAAGEPGRQTLWGELLQRTRALPGVRRAGLSWMTPLSGRFRGVGVRVEGFQPRSRGDEEVSENDVSDGYFEALDIQVVRGRAFAPNDQQASPKVAIVNETAAKFYFGDRNPLGATLDFGKSPLSDGVFKVVGVVRDTKHRSLREPAKTLRMVYLPVFQPRYPVGRLSLLIKTDGDPVNIVSAVRQQVNALAPDILVTEILTVQQHIDASLVQERLMSTLAGFFGVLALLLSAVGLYGVLSHVVNQRAAEIGIRMALGAGAGAVVWMIMRRSLALVGIGVAVGVPAALLAARPLESMLYGLKATDSGTIAIGTCALVATAMFASYLPARRASRIDPMLALRND